MITACNELPITVSTPPPPQTLVGGERHLMQKGFFSLSKNSFNRHHALLLYVLPFRFVQIYCRGRKKRTTSKDDGANFVYR